MRDGNPMPQGTASEEIAIVGMACLFPGAGSLGQFWQNIIEGRSTIGDPPADWGGGQKHYDPRMSDNDRISCLRGGYLGELARFDPLDYGVMPKAVDGAEPEHFLALRVATEALADAGYPGIPLNRERTEVILARGTFVNRALMSLHQHGTVIEQTMGILRQLLPQANDDFLGEVKSRLKAKLPPFDPLTAGGVVSSIMSGLIANRLDLKGANYCLDAACASSLLAVERGIEDLRTGRCDAVIAGGVQLAANHLVMMVFSQLGALSRQSEIRPFDASADGTLLGEGVGMMVLKRRQDAERNGNRIYALIRGVGSASDGRAKSILAPRAEGQELALNRAYENASVEPSSIGLIEAHGTGIPLGDATELESLRRVFGESPDKSCAIGSVKSMIGHLIPASGMASLIKTALSLYHRTLPPSILCDKVSKELEPGPFYLNSELRPWIHGSATAHRRAGVSAFGFGGINAHAVLKEYPDDSERVLLNRRWPSELCVLAGESRGGLIHSGERLQRFLAKQHQVELADVAFTLHTELDECSESKPTRLAIVANNTAELQKKLSHALKLLHNPKRKRIRDRSGIFFFEERLADTGKLIFIFPGEGSQYPGMLADLCMHFPEVRDCFDTAELAFLSGDDGVSLAGEIFPPPTVSAAGERLMEMEFGVPAVTTANRALFGLIDRLGVTSDAVVGHSSGEFSALEACGMLRLETADSAFVSYIQAGAASVRGVSAAARGLDPVSLVATSPEDVNRVYQLTAQTDGRVQVTMDNCPLQVVLCGPQDAVAKLTKRLKQQGIACKDLPFHRPYHSARFEPACGALREFFSKVDFVAPRIPIYSCATAAPFDNDPVRARELAVSQWTRSVRFRETIEALYADGARLFVEVGPKNNLSAFVSDTLHKRPHLVVPLNRQYRSGITELQLALGQLTAHGVAMDLTPLFARRTPQRLDLDGEPDATRELPTLRLALPHLELDADDLYEIQAITPLPRGEAEAPQGVSKPAGEPSMAVMNNYFETMRDFLRVQEHALDMLEIHTESGAQAANRSAAPQPTLTRGQSTCDTQRLPFVGEIVEQRGNDHLVMRRLLDLDEDLFLRHHALGGRVSLYDPELLPLTLVPMTMSMEMLAEAAQVISENEVVLGMSNVHAHRWIALRKERLEIVISARRKGPQLIHVEVREAAPGGPLPPIIEGTVRFARAYPQAPVANTFALSEARPSRFKEDQMYQTGMFSGPGFQGVASIERWSPNGAVARLQALPTHGLFRSIPKPMFLIDPVILDAVGQVAAHWNAEAHSSGFNFFPYRFESLDLFGPALETGNRAECNMMIKRLDANRFRSDFEVVRPDRRLHLRLTGWEDRSFTLPEAFWGIRAGVPDRAFTKAWPVSLPDVATRDAFCCRRADSFDPELLFGSGQIWLEVLARQVLSQAERTEWEALDKSKRHRFEWLLGRLVAKDAVRFLLRRRHGLDLCPADIELQQGPDGRPIALGKWRSQAPQPAVSIACSGNVAVGVAAETVNELQIGIDLEQIRQLEPGFTEVGFYADELTLLQSLPEEVRDQWILRLWCAKEAVAKTLGEALAGSAKSYVSRTVDVGSGHVEVEVRKSVDGLDSNPNPSRLIASTDSSDGYVVALSTYLGS